MIVSAPASSANLGPGFDCLGLAVALPFELADQRPAGEGWLRAEPTHPAVGSFVAAGGDPSTELWWRSPIPPGRGLGFSGASRVAGAYLAGRCGGLDHRGARAGALVVATGLEGHADNAAASAMGGFTVAAGDRTVALAVPRGVELLVWWPQRSTSTDASRRVLAESVSLSDATFSIARASMWVAAMASGDLDALRTACEDRVHQPQRLAARPDAAEALERLMADAEVLGAWLSGSGPTVAAMVREGQGSEALVDSLPPGRSRRLRIATEGVAPSPHES